MRSATYADSHYAYIENHGAWFSEQLGVADISKMVVAHGDKSRQYFDLFEELGFSPKKGALVHLLTYSTYCQNVRPAEGGWIGVERWMKHALTCDTDIINLLKKLPD